MGKLVVTEFVSLDGVFEDPRWTFEFDRGKDGDAFKLGELEAADAQLLGRVTYEGFASAWPSRSDQAGFAQKMNDMPKYVVSSTLVDPSWNNTTVLDGSIAAGVGALKQRYSGDILVAGSGRLARSLLADGLVDELRLMVFPVLLGWGRRLFSEGTPKTTLRLAGIRQVGPDGVAILTYAPAGH
ncbi:MAG: dihydrofolate reductase family protein [Streptosporangiaceae bacterium]